MWTSFFRDGGWGMYPTAIFGFALIAASVLLALRPERRFAVLVGTLGLLTLGAGVLGTATGLITTFRYLARVPEADQFKIAALGCAESLNNLVFALMLGVLATLLASIAALRAARANTPVTPAG
jgi:hypothetical protein